MCECVHICVCLLPHSRPLEEFQLFNYNCSLTTEQREECLRLPGSDPLTVVWHRPLHSTLSYCGNARLLESRGLDAAIKPVSGWWRDTEHIKRGARIFKETFLDLARVSLD